jgi:hypothetical protein
MADDDYQYQPKPLPEVSPYGGTQRSSSAPPQPVTITTADNTLTDDPFGNPAALPSYAGAGVEPALTCDSSAIIGTLNTSLVAFPCDTPTSSISDAGISLTISGGTFDQNTAGGTLIITLSGKTISIDIASLPGAATASFREFENCNGQKWWALATEPI